MSTSDDDRAKSRKKFSSRFTAPHNFCERFFTASYHFLTLCNFFSSRKISKICSEHDATSSYRTNKLSTNNGGYYSLIFDREKPVSLYFDAVCPLCLCAPSCQSFAFVRSTSTTLCKDYSNLFHRLDYRSTVYCNGRPASIASCICSS